VTIVAMALVILASTVVAARDPMTLGVSIDPARTRLVSEVDAFTARTGTQPAIWSTWSTWGSRGANVSLKAPCKPGFGSCSFPLKFVNALVGRGITPMIWWAPSGGERDRKGWYSRYKNITAGKHDKYIEAWAAAAARVSGKATVLVRFAHEMNGQWFPWGLGRYDNSPKRFKAAWRYIWQKFKAAGATNVKMIWSPIREGCEGCRPNYRFESFYPGNRYVPYAGMTALNWGAKRWRSLPSIVADPLARLRQVTRTRAKPAGKPVILAELASYHRGGDKAGWITTGYNKVFRKWPSVVGIVYLDANIPVGAYGTRDWRLAKPADGSALAAYSAIAARPKFKGSIQ
jgi:hypothetical protein